MTAMTHDQDVTLPVDVEHGWREILASETASLSSNTSHARPPGRACMALALGHIYLVAPQPPLQLPCVSVNRPGMSEDSVV